MPPATSPPAQQGPKFSFIVCGDPQNNYEVFDRILAAAKTVDFLIIAGDLTGSGTPTEFATFVSKMQSSGVTYYCVPGNHDVATSPVESSYARYCGKPFYSFDHLNTHFVMIDDSTPSQGFYPAERQWAGADMAAAKKRGFQHMFAVAHVPPGYPYSMSPGRNDALGLDANGLLAPELKKGGVEELFCGHVHAYSEEEIDGLQVTITGGAGAPLMLDPANGGYYNYVRVDINGRDRQQTVVKI
jgi:3',5'-cyclic AMP phosphodiesterase CpdA